jgi:hypothetical protein
VEIIGILIVILLLGGGTAFVAHEVGKAREAGALVTAPKTGSRKGRAKAAARSAPQNARTIFAQAWADNWVARKAHIRETRAAAPPKPPRRPLLQRLVAPGQPGAFGGAPAAVAPAAVATRRIPAPSPGRTAPVGHDPNDYHYITDHDRHPRSQCSTQKCGFTPGGQGPGPAPNGRTAPVSSAPPSAAPTGAAADMFSAANVLNGHARAGGIHGKLRGEKVYGEALAFIASALEQFAKDMQEAGRYPAMTWEPVITAAAHVRAGGLAMGEAANALAGLMKMPLGELASSPVQAPHHDELNRA